jgi:hypothetical protein
VSKYLIEKIDKKRHREEVVPWLFCPVCSNQDERFVTNDGATGDMICLGSDGRGCGAVLLDHMLSERRSPYYEHMDDLLYSDHYHHRSHWGNDKRHFLRKVNQLIEKKMTGFQHQGLVTSDHYKDQQRDYVYGVLGNMIETTSIDQHLIEKVKILYHVYRTHMSRIHQLEIVLAAMFYIVMNQP